MMSLNQMQRRNSFMSKFVTGFIAFVFIMIIAMFGLFGYVAYEAVSMIQTEGLKGVVDTIWNGSGK